MSVRSSEIYVAQEKNKVSPKKRASNDKWDKENGRVFSIKIYKKDFDLFDKFKNVGGETNVEKLKNLINKYFENS